jgi:hypothetical protein
MKSYTDYLWFNTERRREYICITDLLQNALEKKIGRAHV